MSAHHWDGDPASDVLAHFSKFAAETPETPICCWCFVPQREVVQIRQTGCGRAGKVLGTAVRDHTDGLCPEARDMTARVLVVGREAKAA